MTGPGNGRSFHRIVHRFVEPPAPGTLLPALVVDGWGAGEATPRPHTVPVAGARWTLLLLARADRPQVDEHRARLAAESVAPVVVDGALQLHAAVLVDPLGVVQHVTDDILDALDVVAAFRTGALLPIPAARVLGHRSHCPAEGRRRPGSRFVAARRGRRLA
jgi:hypothetical protein